MEIFKLEGCQASASQWPGLQLQECRIKALSAKQKKEQGILLVNGSCRSLQRGQGLGSQQSEILHGAREDPWVQEGAEPDTEGACRD